MTLSPICNVRRAGGEASLHVHASTAFKQPVIANGTVVWADGTLGAFDIVMRKLEH